MREHGEESLTEVTVQREIVFIRRQETTLAADLYLPRDRADFPALVALHGGGWKRGDRSRYHHLGNYLAQHGVALFAADYRLANPDKGFSNYPAAVADVRDAIRYLRKNAVEFGIDPDRIGVIGDSAGGHLGSLVALAGNEPRFRDADADASLEGVTSRVKVVVGVYGVYDMLAQWDHDQRTRPLDHITESFLGISAIENRIIYQEASPLTYVTSAAAGLSFLIAWGTADDICEPKTQSEAFVEALKRVGCYVRTVIVSDAPHFWISDPIEEANSYTGFLAPRLLRFLKERL
jgi:acetyl esterase/lipase